MKRRIKYVLIFAGLVGIGIFEAMLWTASGENLPLALPYTIVGLLSVVALIIGLKL